MEVKFVCVGIGKTSCHRECKWNEKHMVKSIFFTPSSGSVFLSGCNLAHMTTLLCFLIYLSPFLRHRVAFWSPCGAFTRRLFHSQRQAVPSLCTDGWLYGITLFEFTVVYSTGPALMDFEVICNLLQSQTILQWVTMYVMSFHKYRWTCLYYKTARITQPQEMR